MKILVEVSSRHVHLSSKDFISLFGQDATLSKKKKLSQPGQFLAHEKVTISGPRDSINNVAIIGPFREKTQIEISLTDARKLGIAVPIRESGNTQSAPDCTLCGPCGQLHLKNSIIAVLRHLHLDPRTAANLDLFDGQTAEVLVATESRPTIFQNVLVRVHENFCPTFHIDTDEANAAGVFGEIFGEILTKNSF